MTQLESEVRRYMGRLWKKSTFRTHACPNCKYAGRLRRHGIYRRSLIVPGKTLAIPIRRVICGACGHTFPLLPDFVLKFHRYARAIIRLALRGIRSLTYERVADLVTDLLDRYVASLTIRFWQRKWNGVL